MLRVIGLTLVIVTGAAKVAQAENRYDGPAANRIETAQRHTPDTHQAALDDHDGVQLQIGGGLGFTPAGQDEQRGSGTSGPGPDRTARSAAVTGGAWR